MNVNRDLHALSQKLNRASERGFNNPYTSIQWPEALDPQAWQFAPEFVSLHGTPLWDALDEPARRRLAFHEACNFFSLNIHGEQELIAGLARRAYQQGDRELIAYLHHFLDEENKHMLWFGEYCMRYLGRIYPDRKLAFPREFAAGEEDLLFFAKVMVFEFIVDAYNLSMGRDERLDPLARQIHWQHHVDEARHLAFGASMVAKLKDTFFSQCDAQKQCEIRDYLHAYTEATWREYYNPDVYKDAGFEDPYGTMDAAWQHPATRAFRARIAERLDATLAELGLAAAEPA
jgi:hypothetical protein